MLVLTISPMRYVRLTSELVILPADSLALVVSFPLHLLLQRLWRMRMMMLVMRMRTRMLALSVMMRSQPLCDLPFVIRDKKGE